MTSLPRILLLFFVVISSVSAETEPAWTPLDLPSSKGPAATKLLEEKGIPVLSWSNAVVEVSSFGELETVVLANLDKQLTPQDPRWDPWLKSLAPLFRPQESVFRIWVEPSRIREAVAALGADASAANFVPAGPRQVTGWALAAFCLLYLILRLWADGEDSRAVSPPARSWLWLPLTLVLAGGGLYLALGRSVSGTTAAKVSASWIQHLWFQEAWPYGAQWTDWAPGKAWTYRSYDRKAGRIIEVTAALPVPDKAWTGDAWRRLDPHHVARIFPPPNP